MLLAVPRRDPVGVELLLEVGDVLMVTAARTLPAEEEEIRPPPGLPGTARCGGRSVDTAKKQMKSKINSCQTQKNCLPLGRFGGCSEGELDDRGSCSDLLLLLLLGEGEEGGIGSSSRKLYEPPFSRNPIARRETMTDNGSDLQAEKITLSQDFVRVP